MSCPLRGGGGGGDGIPRRRHSGEGGRAGLGREASARREEPVQVLSLSGKRPEVGAQDHGDCGGELCSWPRQPWRDAGRRGRATARPGGAGARVAGEQQQKKKEEAARHGGDARRALCAQTAPWTT